MEKVTDYNKVDWKHSSGRIYSVIALSAAQTDDPNDVPVESVMIVNAQTTRPEEYPVTVIYLRTNGMIGAMTKDDWDNNRQKALPPTIVYEGINGLRWCRPLTDWHRSMTERKDEEHAN